jgi:hypothetical protein
MSCLPTWKRQEYLEQLERVEAQIALLETAIDSAYENSEVEEYSFNSAEGSQRTKRRSIKEISQELEKLESRKMRILNKLYGRAILNLNLRRKR